MAISKLNIGRTLILVGFLVGWESFYQTFNHIGDPLFTLPEEFGGGTTHAWYHALRELMGDVATVTAILFVFFAGSRWRVPATWWICLIAMLGYYSPFWIGMPFNSALAAPTWDAEIRHIIQAALPLSGLFVSRSSFFSDSDPDS
jgi:hypothetical protein